MWLRMSTETTRRLSGIGLGWRPELATFAAHTGLGFAEVIAESVDPRRLPRGLDAARRAGLTVIPHGVGLSLGGSERPDPRRLAHLAGLAEQLDAPLVSEHIAYVRADGIEAGHLLPVARTQESLEILCQNVAEAQAALPVALAVEHIAALVEWPGNELDEATFVSELVARTGVLLLLDVSNLYANAFNHGWDALEALRRFPLEQIAYVHVGGGVHRDGMYHDTHADPVVPGVLALVEELFAIADAPGVLLERDNNFPSEIELAEELAAIAAAAARGSARRNPIPGDAPTRVARPRRGLHRAR
jgi:uncharacterized protein (UPF0276 family)